MYKQSYRMRLVSQFHFWRAWLINYELAQQKAQAENKTLQISFADSI